MKPLAEKLERVIQSSPHWAEMRYHHRETQTLQVQKDLVKLAQSQTIAGIGIRVLCNGAWGFAATSQSTPEAAEKCLKQAIECAQSLSRMKEAKIEKLPPTTLARGEFSIPGLEKLRKIDLKEKLEAVRNAEQQTRKNSSKVHSATCTYQEHFEKKIVITTDGANAISDLARNEFRLSAVAEESGQSASANRSIGKTGDWDCLFREHSVASLTEEAAKLAIDLTSAPRVDGGLKTLILSPAMVGLLSHEAIGHTVEADFVLSGSVAAGKLGQNVASPLINLVDSGQVSLSPHAGGDLLVDDEGIPTQTTHIIKDGKLNSYLHNRESAAHFGVTPTGNARAWLYSNEPLIRMRNTYILPGTSSLEEMIASTKDGYFIDGPLGGQADATGEFMFGAQKVSRIKDGKITELLRGATISGQAFQVLSSVDAVSKEFELDLGAGYCGKGQPAKVDAGGPYIRCQASIAGAQS